MIRIEHLQVFNFEGAIRGLRNPLNSWDKGDTIYGEFDVGREIYISYNPPHIGPNDLDLMKRLYKGGTEHRKYLRQIFVSMDITAPLYWIAELDTYKVGTTRNSCSFMHKGISKPFDDSDFDKHSDEIQPQVWGDLLNELNRLRDVYLETGDPQIFQTIRDLLPSGYLQKFTTTMNYENVVNIINQRKNHRLVEWRMFCDIMLEELPYLKEIMAEDVAYWINISDRDLHDVRTGAKLCFECPQCHCQQAYSYNFCSDCGKKLLINGDSDEQ